jgi:type III restriction enzyme
VEAFIKVNEYYHEAAKVSYVREDGLMATYSPDFLVQTKDSTYIVETKAQANMSQGNVKQKQVATVDFVERVNKLKGEDRMDREWKYVLLGENVFNSMKKNGATPTDMFEYCLVTKDFVVGTLF